MKTNDTMDMGRKASIEGCVNIYVADIEVNLEELLAKNNPHLQQDEEASGFPEENNNEAEALKHESEELLTVLIHPSEGLENTEPHDATMRILVESK